MPFKEALKKSEACLSPKPIKKGSYRVTNWTEYNESLRKRGKLSQEKTVVLLWTRGEHPITMKQVRVVKTAFLIDILISYVFDDNYSEVRH